MRETEGREGIASAGVCAERARVGIARCAGLAASAPTAAPMLRLSCVRIEGSAGREDSVERDSAGMAGEPQEEAARWTRRWDFSSLGVLTETEVGEAIRHGAGRSLAQMACRTRRGRVRVRKGRAHPAACCAPSPMAYRHHRAPASADGSGRRGESSTEGSVDMETGDAMGRRGESSTAGCAPTRGASKGARQRQSPTVGGRRGASSTGGRSWSAVLSKVSALGDVDGGCLRLAQSIRHLVLNKHGLQDSGGPPRPRDPTDPDARGSPDPALVRGRPQACCRS